MFREPPFPKAPAVPAPRPPRPRPAKPGFAAGAPPNGAPPPAPGAPPGLGLDCGLSPAGFPSVEGLAGLVDLGLLSA